MPKRINKSSPLVLIAEDHGDSRSLLKLLLEMRGCLVIEAADGEAAVWMAEKNCPDLILMDVTLPHLNGVDALRQIRKFKGLGDVPVLFLSAHAEKGFSEAAFSAGANDYLVKPLDLNQLENIVNKHLRRIRKF